MNRIMKFFLWSITLGLLAIGAHLYYLTTLSATETYPEDFYLDSEKNKIALIIVAHDDDAVGSAGTISMLCNKGWIIREMCFYQAGGLYFKKDSTKNQIRKKSLTQAAKIQGLKEVVPIDFNLKFDMTSKKGYMPVPYEEFPKIFKIDSLKTFIGNFIQRHKPSVIFTLDDSIGGYGHPDHVLISRLVLDYCKTHRNDSSFSVKKIYQPVFPPSLAESILKDNPTYVAARQVYQCKGMPLPDVQVNFYPYAKQKKAAMLSYITEQNSLKLIWPYYRYYPSWVYFKIFDRDFFRVITMDEL